jgi:hypothetical protein
MTEPPKPVRKRKAPTQLLISEESQAALRARLDSEEGQRCLDEFAARLDGTLGRARRASRNLRAQQHVQLSLRHLRHRREPRGRDRRR